MKKFTVLSIFFLLPIFVFAQSRIEKSTLQKIIKKSQVEKHKGAFTLPSDKAWHFNNSDSLYFKPDTITAIIYKS